VAPTRSSPARSSPATRSSRPTPRAQGAYTAALRKQSKANQFWEDKAKQTWKIYFAAFFKKGLTDIEVVVKLYDVTNSSPEERCSASFEQYVDQRGQTALLVEQFTLERKLVGVNKQRADDHRGRRPVGGVGQVQDPRARRSG
jgi:hypothetical protein